MIAKRAILAEAGMKDEGERKKGETNRAWLAEGCCLFD
jgi:hypothetical protein